MPVLLTVEPAKYSNTAMIITANHRPEGAATIGTRRLYLAAAWVLIALCGPRPVWGEEITVAVASNFSRPAKQIAAAFEQSTGHRVRLAFGATGKHYAHILNGAPFDLFLAADSRRPALLESRGKTVPGTRFTYARGTLVLWSKKPGLVDSEGRILAGGDFNYLAMANPRLAPYGRAARQVLEARQQWTGLQPRLVRGENINQTYQYVHSGAAQLGFVSLSQIVRPAADGEAAAPRNPQSRLPGSHWLVPRDLYDPIDQQAVLLRDSRTARKFLAYLKGEAALAVLRAYGYRHPPAELSSAPGTTDVVSG